MKQPANLYFQIHYSNGESIEVVKPFLPEYLVGRHSKTVEAPGQILLSDNLVSRQHCRIYFDRSLQKWLVEDLGSSNGTRMSGDVITQPLPIQVGEELRLGSSRLTFDFAPRLNPVNAVLANGYDEDSTILRGHGGLSPHQSAFDGSDSATLLINPSSDGVETYIEAGSHFRPGSTDDEGATILADQLTLFGAPPRDEGATILADRCTLMGAVPGDEGATVLADQRTLMNEAPGDEGAMFLSDQRTLTGAAPEDAGARPLSDQGGQVVHATEDLETLARQAIELKAVSAVVHRAVEAAGRGVKKGARQTLGSLLQKDKTTSRAAQPKADEDKESTKEDSRFVQGIELALQEGFVKRLLDSGMLDVKKARSVLIQAQINGESFFSILLKDRSVKFLGEICSLLASYYHLEFIGSEQELSDRAEESKHLTYKQGFLFEVVPLRSSEKGRPLVGMIDPFDPVRRDVLKKRIGVVPRCVLIHPDIYFPTMRRLMREASEEGSDSAVVLDIDINPDQEKSILEMDGQNAVDIPQMVNYFLHTAHLQGASDVHVEPTEEVLLVRNRVDGVLHEVLSIPSIFHPAVVSRLKILSGMDVAEKRRPQDGRFSVNIRRNPIDLRVSSFPTVFGEKFVLRLLDKNALRPSIENIGLLARDLELLKDKLNAPYGLILISGPTGSGKTTTLYSCLGGIDKDRRNVLTVEDPVEYRLKGVHQMQVNSKIGLTFATGLRTILRQDPDVIMVGEIRDAETAHMAVQASLTGHIVFSTIHTNDAIGVITRLLDMGIEPFMVATSVSVAIAQRLVRAICPQCREYVTGKVVLGKLRAEGISAQRLEELNIVIDPKQEYSQGRGDGCGHCRETGYAGRRPVFEVFEVTDEVRNVIMSKDGSFSSGKLKQLAKERGMTTLIKHGMGLVEEEITTTSEIIRVLGESF